MIPSNRDNSDNTEEEKDQLWLDIIEFLDNSVSSSKYLSLAVFQSIMVSWLLSALQTNVRNPTEIDRLPLKKTSWADLERLWRNG